MNTFGINTVRFGSAAIMLNMGMAGVHGLHRMRMLVPKDTELLAWLRIPDEMSRKEWVQVAIGVLFVTVGCPALSNYALFEIPLGICLTLTSVGPLYALPLTYLVKGEPITWASAVASVMATGGVALLYLL
eukprot:g2753.t1